MSVSDQARDVVFIDCGWPGRRVQVYFVYQLGDAFCWTVARRKMLESCLKLEVDYAYLGLEGSQVTILVCKCKRTGCPGCDAGSGEGHECLCSSLLYSVAARSGMELIVVDVRQ